MVGDFDSWYVDAKKLAEDNVIATSSHSNNNNTHSIFALAKDTVSFHYVSEAESLLLYQLLGPVDAIPASPVHPLCLESHRGWKNFWTSLETDEPQVTQCSTWRDLMQVWPRTQEEAGDFSRPLSPGYKGVEQAGDLYKFLSEIATSMRT